MSATVSSCARNGRYGRRNSRVPAAGTIDAPLISGSAIFGIGWGLSGYCPGPAVVSLASGRRGVILFVVAMLAGMIAVRWMRTSRAAGTHQAAPLRTEMNNDPRLAIREGSMTSFQMVVVVICVVLNMVDGFDVLAMSFTAPLIAREWGVDPATLGVLLSAGLVGMGVGALFISPIADVIGRRAVVILSTVIMSVGMFASAATTGVLELWLCRFVTGLGIGGVLASGNTLLAEYAPNRWRDFVISTMVIGYPVGAIIGGSIFAVLVSLYGWRSAFVFGGLASTVLVPLDCSLSSRDRSTSSCRAGARIRSAR